MRKLKIGISGTRGIPNNYGGFEQFAQHLSLGLLKKGHEVYVYNSDQHPFKEKEWKGVQIIHCRDWEHKVGTWGQFYYDLNCNQDARRRKFDILLHLGYSSDAIWYCRWPKKTINIVNMDGLEWKRSKYSRPVQRFLKWSESLAAKHAQVMVADSPEIQTYLFDRYQKKAVCIPYGAELFREGDPAILEKYGIQPLQYYLLIARMEKENNIEMIIRGWMASDRNYPLVVVGDTGNKFGKYIKTCYHHPGLQFTGPIYDQAIINNLRFYSSLYFHGHSVGGTNPSLLEAMACGCRIAAHDNPFNRAVLQEEADYFSDENGVRMIIGTQPDLFITRQRKELNTEKILNIYNHSVVIDDYEYMMLNAR